MHAEIVAIGDEITSGQLLDTNSQWLSRRLHELGIRVLYHTTVGDELQACADVFRAALRRADLVISTGGLGPTADDLTREAIARATDRSLVLNEAALRHVRAMFARRKRPMPPSNERQALFPEGAVVIDNPNGTAPGIDLTVPREIGGAARIFALPGVPPEMKEMWRQTVADAAHRFAGGDHVIRHRAIKCFGAGESQIEAMLPDLIRRGRIPTVGINASKTTIILRVTAEGETEQAALAVMEPTVRTIRETLGNLVFGEGDDELQDAVIRLLAKRGRTLATVEWGTAGLVVDWMGEAAAAAGTDSGANRYLGGLVIRSDAALSSILNVPRDLVARHSTLSTQVVEAMAEHGRHRFGADMALAVGRFPDVARFQDDAPEMEPEVVHFALTTPDGIISRTFPFAGHPAMLKILCAKLALNMVRLELLNE